MYNSSGRDLEFDSAIRKFQGALAGLSVSDLGAVAIRAEAVAMAIELA